MNFKFTGDRQVIANLEAIQHKIPGAVGSALYEIAEEIISKSKPRVPVDTGALRNSAFVEHPKTDGGEVTVTLGYGGPAAPYAVYVHEGTIHMKGFKYLEEPVLDMLPKVAQKVAQKVGRVVS